MKRQKLEKIIQQQKIKGLKPEVILALALQAGISESEVVSVLKKNFSDFKFTPNPRSKAVWGPFKKLVKEKDFESANQKLKDKFETFLESPESYRKLTTKYLCQVGVLILVGYIFFGAILWMLEPITLILYFYGPLIILYIKRKKIIEIINQRALLKLFQWDLLTQATARKYGWIYNPNGSENRWNELVQIVPVLLGRGEIEQSLEAELWGRVKVRKKEIPFYSANFKYGFRRVNEDGESFCDYKNRFVLCFKLEKKLKETINLVPETPFSLWKSNLGITNDIEVESKSFNEKFRIFNNSFQTPKDLLTSYKSLSPAFQVASADLAHRYKGISIAVSDDLVCLTLFGTLEELCRKKFFNKEFNHKLKTDLLKNLTVDEADIKVLYSFFHHLIRETYDVTKYLK